MSQQHRVLVVGVGSIGERHVRCFGATGRAKISICELNPTLRQTIADRYQVEEAFDSYDAALAAKPEVVLIATPANTHIPLALKAVDRDCHLLMEKPLSTELTGVDELLQRIEQRGVVSGMAYVMRCYPALAAMQAALQSGRFGKPVQIVAVAGQNFPHYRPAYREIYYNNHATGGGAVQDALTHVINVGEWLVGPIDRLVSDLAHLVLPGVEVEDTVNVLARHSEILGSYSLNQHQAPGETTITVNCTQGTVRFEHVAHRWRWMVGPDSGWHDEPFEPFERDGPFTWQAAAFLDAVEGKTKPLCSIQAGEQTLRASLSILASAKSGRWETLSSLKPTKAVASQR